MKAIESRSPVDQSLRFRLLDEGAWKSGRTVNVSRSGMLFSSPQALEIGTVVEVETNLKQIGSKGPRIGVVVRRVLMAWPEVNALAAIQFIEERPLPV